MHKSFILLLLAYIVPSAQASPCFASKAASCVQYVEQTSIHLGQREACLDGFCGTVVGSGHWETRFKIVERVIDPNDPAFGKTHDMIDTLYTSFAAAKVTLGDFQNSINH